MQHSKLNTEHSGFTLIELSIAIIVLSLIYVTFQVSKKLINKTDNLVTLNQTDNDWEIILNNVLGNEGGSEHGGAGNGINATSGVDGTGGGGGGDGAHLVSAAAAGGSGIVVVRYEIQQ